MSFFDDDEEPKKNRIRKNYVPEEERNKKKEEKQGQEGSRRRRGREKREQKKAQEPKKERIYPPLMIRARANEEESELPIDDYVTEIYLLREQSKQERKIQGFMQEDDQGNTEYKYKLIRPSDDRLDHLATQMKFRIKEGRGDAHYRIGVQDNGRPTGLDQEQMLQSLRTICLLAGRVGADVMVLRVCDGFKGLVVELLIRKQQRMGVKLEVRVLLAGQSGSGKSTLLGVLKSGHRDDGKGMARVRVFTHKHQFLSGTTQSRSHHVIGFDSQGQLYNQEGLLSVEKWLDHVNKILTFIDVGGHRKAQKQLVSSLCSFFPQYALWVVSGIRKTAINSQTLELASIFRLPLIVVITHLDQMDKTMELQAILRIKEQLRKFFPDKTPCLVRQMQHAVLFSRITSSEDVVPIFLISNVTGKNLQLLTSFLNLLTASSELSNNQDLNTEFLIADKYVVDGNIILAGTVVKGTVKKGQLLHIGPDMKGAFRAVEVKSIQCLRVPVKVAKCGQVCTLAIRPLNYALEWLAKQPSAIRRGMVLVDGKSNPKAVYQFLVEFTPYSTEREEFSVTQKYLPVINTLTTRQICTIVVMKPPKELQLPQSLLKKKSKSIDARKMENSHVYSYSMKKVQVRTPKIKKPMAKKSVDLSMQTFNENGNQLQPIAEQLTTKKVRQITEIHFGSGDVTPLRLRFKYNPQYLTLGQKVIINELKLVGKVKEIYY